MPSVLAGGGLCLAHDLIAADLIDSGRLVAPFEDRAPMPESYYLILTPQAETRPEVLVFVSWLKTQLSGFDGTQA